MLILSICFLVYVAVSLWYIHKIHVRLRSHEEDWNRIEQITDHNEDGDVVIHVKHT